MAKISHGNYAVCGSYVSAEKNDDPAGITTFYPEEKVASLYDTEVFPIPEGGGVSYKGNEEPKIPKILVPTEITLYVNEKFSVNKFKTFEIPFNEFMLFSLPNYTTDYSIVLENDTKNNPISELKVSVIGDSLTKVPGGAVEVSLNNLSSFKKNIPTFKIKIPSNADALNFYKDSSVGNIRGTFDILYLGSVFENDKGDTFEVFRQNYYFSIPVKIINSSSEPQPTSRVGVASYSNEEYKETIPPPLTENFDITPLGNGKVSVHNKLVDTTLILPDNYPILKGTNTDIISRVLTEPRKVGNFGPKGYQNIEKRTTPSSEIVKKLKRTEYYDGVKSSQYSFYDTFSVAPPINQAALNSMEDDSSPNKGKKSLFNQEFVDFTIAAIKRINIFPEEYNDFVYNALTTTKIKDSFSRNVKSLLSGRFNLDGTPFIDTISAAVKTALIAAEDNYFSITDIHNIITRWGFDTESLVVSNNSGANYAKAVEIISDKALSLVPGVYDIVNKNRLLNWKVLAEDVGKNVRVKTSDGTETKLLIPNSETLTVYDATGGEHTLEMQDGNYFVANPVTGDERLTVFYDTGFIGILKPKELAQVSRLLNQKYTMQLTCTSLESDLLELNVDTTGARQDYYFLKLDKSTISDDVPDNPLFKKTSATYNYITDTSVMDSYIKHRAFPSFMVYLRDDDIIFNHLESSLKAQATFNDPSLDAYVSQTQIGSIVRRFPWYIILIPTDVTSNIPTQARSVLENFSTRTISLEPGPEVKKSTFNPPFLKEKITPIGSINYGVDIEKRVIYTEDREYSISFGSLGNMYKYRAGSEVLPRKLHPTNIVLQKINELKTAYSLTEQDTLSFYDLYTRLSPKDFRSLSRDHDLGAAFLRRLRSNKVAETKSINKEKFLALRDIPQTGVNIVAPELSIGTMSQRFAKKKTIGALAVPIAVVGAVEPQTLPPTPTTAQPPRPF